MRCLYADRSQTSIDQSRMNGLQFPNKVSVRLSFDLRESRREKTHVSSHCWLHKSVSDSSYLVPDEMPFARWRLRSTALVEHEAFGHRVLAYLIYPTYI
jgi:hypothetical protein